MKRAFVGAMNIHRSTLEKDLAPVMKAAVVYDMGRGAGGNNYPLSFANVWDYAVNGNLWIFFGLCQKEAVWSIWNGSLDTQMNLSHRKEMGCDEPSVGSQ